ncbi:MAG: PqqD family protein [Bacteroidaceae bacterium]|nr:PqqD family protein [Bacteroidaceae bacterium]
MKIKNGFELRDVCGEKVVIAQGLENLDFSKLITLNESAAYLWESIAGKTFTETDLVSLLCSEYDVTAEQAATDVQALVAEWEKQGLVED